MKKRIVSILMALALCLMLLPRAALADASTGVNGNEAAIGGTEYATFNAAYNEAQSGDTITLLANVKHTELNRNITLTIDLNGKTWEHTADGELLVSAGKYTIKNGTVSESVILQNAELNLGAGCQLTGDHSQLSIKGGAVLKVTSGNVYVRKLYVGTSDPFTCKLTKGTFGTVQIGAVPYKVGDLLEEGYAFKTTDDRQTWYDKYINSSETVIEDVMVHRQWITGVTLTADEENCTFGDTIQLTASVDRYPGDVAGIYYEWYKDNDSEYFAKTINDRNHSNENPNLCNYSSLSAGTHTIYVKVTTHAYTRTSAPITVTVNKATYGDKTANGSAKYGGSNSVDLSGLIMPGGTPAIYVTDTNNVLNGTPTLNGNKLNFAFKDNDDLVGETATVEVAVTDCTNYENYKITVTLTVNAKNVPTVTAPTAKTLTYNGSEQTLINAAATTSGTLQYSLDNRTWSETLPTGKDATSYTVYYKVVGDANYADVAANSISVTIGKKAITVKPKSYTITKGRTIPTFELEYVGLVDGDTLNITATPTFSCCEADGNTAVSTSTAAGSYTITWTNPADFALSGETNYTVTKATTGTLTINNKPSSSTYTITVKDSENGGVTASRKTARKGTTVTVTVTPDAGYTLETLSVTDKNGNKITLTDNGDGTYSFKMPASKVTVEATFMDDNTMLNFFVDVPASAYYYDAVLWAVKNGITGSIGNNLFAPDESCTRAQIVTFLWRAAGSPEPKAASSFTDVSADAYYAKAVAWAVENGITSGIGNNQFAPNQTCTRAHAVAFLFRYAAANGMEAVTLQELVGGYTDANQVPGYALPAFNWALAKGIVQGYNGNLMPNNDCTRAQIVTMLYRLLGA